MRTRKMTFLAVFLMVCCSFLSTGCLDTIGQQVLVGFGRSIGAIPGEIVGGYLTDLVAGFLPVDGAQ
jgi:hypothetical protein